MYWNFDDLSVWVQKLREGINTKKWICDDYHTPPLKEVPLKVFIDQVPLKILLKRLSNEIFLISSCIRNSYIDIFKDTLFFLSKHLVYWSP